MSPGRRAGEPLPVRITRSSFCYWRRRAAAWAARQAADARLAVRIRAVHRESDGTYGVPRITAELRDEGERVNHKRVARVMRQAGLAGLRRRLGLLRFDGHQRSGAWAPEG
ncbi:IS3 family transposase [Streptomyces sp. NPDC008121]|uniref:IS3 family transposase n=1 Tax=Streptomyces sp. NPDC008121 TaxID=3364809 RepID=UPI0036E732D9